jgi:AcrR family transcriptional regulator
MGLAYHRRKEPERVRRQLLDAAARLAVEHGMAGVTVQAVAVAAGVTKGGLFHHFPTKEALIAGMFEDLLEKFDLEIDRCMAADPDPRGRFTRAYISATFGEMGRFWTALALSWIAEPRLRQLWAEWLRQRLERHQATDGELGVLRFATDGLWLAHLLEPGGQALTDFAEVQRQLVALSRRDTLS